MSLIVTERWDALKTRISRRVWVQIQHKAAWEQITLSAVVMEYPSLLPKRLQTLAASCFVDTRDEWLEARRLAVTKTLRWIEREQRKAQAKADKGEQP